MPRIANLGYFIWKCLDRVAWNVPRSLYILALPEGEEALYAPGGSKDTCSWLVSVIAIAAA